MTHVAQLPDSAKTGTTRRASFSPKNSTNPYIGIAGVFLGAGLATLNGRLVSVGLPDLRRALILGFDEASWLPAALNMATMFAGCFVVFLSAIYGVRRILLPAAGVFALTSFLLPLAPGYWRMLALIVIAGLTFRHLLFANSHIRFERPSEEVNHLRHGSLRCRHCIREQLRLIRRGLVRRASLLALDLLECVSFCADH